MTKKFYIKFGPIYTEIRFDPSLHKVAGVIKEWLRGGLVPTGNNPDIIFTLVSGKGGKSDLQKEMISGNGWLAGGNFGCWDKRGWKNCIFREKVGGKYTFYWECKPCDGHILAIAKRVPSILIKFAHPHFFSYNEMLASTFLYRQLIPAVQVSLLEHDATFIHSSAIRHSKGNGIIISGWGGSGKTSASSFLYMNNPNTWQYLSDDLSILSANGTIHFCPIPLNIFPYNTEQFQHLEDVIMENMGFLERLHWRIREQIIGKSGVVRRIPPLQNNSYQFSSKLNIAIHLQRSANEEPIINKCTSLDFAKAAKNILSYELRHGWNIYLLANSFVGKRSYILPEPDKLARLTEEIIERACTTVMLACITVPSDYGPAKVSEVVERVAVEGLRNHLQFQ